MRLHHLSLLLLLGLVGTCATQAARAPDPRPWVDGWRPYDPYERAIFERKGDELTISMPRRPFSWPFPRLLREVSDDFVAEVRLNGSFRPTNREEEGFGARVSAGMMLQWEKDRSMKICREAYRVGDKVKTQLCAGFTPGNCAPPHDVNIPGWSSEREVYLRLSCYGNYLIAAFSADGKKWHEIEPIKSSVPSRLKLGVFAESSSAELFQPRFDKFKVKMSGK